MFHLQNSKSNVINRFQFALHCKAVLGGFEKSWMFVALNAPSQLSSIYPAGTGGALRQAKPQRPAFPPSKNCQLLARILRHSTSSTYSECAHTRKGVSRVSLCVRLVPQPSSRRIQRQLVLYVQLTFPLGQDGGKELTEQP